MSNPTKGTFDNLTEHINNLKKAKQEMQPQLPTQPSKMWKSTTKFKPFKVEKPFNR